MADLIRAGKIALLVVVSALLVVTTWNAVRGNAAPDQGTMIQRDAKTSMLMRD